jgi:hypothetical protein
MSDAQADDSNLQSALVGLSNTSSATAVSNGSFVENSTTPPNGPKSNDSNVLDNQIFATLPQQDQGYLSDNMLFGEPMHDPFDLLNDGDAFLENVDFSSLFLPTGFGLDQNFQLDAQLGANNDLQEPPLASSLSKKDSNPPETNPEQNSISRLGSPLPSLRPEARTISKQVPSRPVDPNRPIPCWKISKQDFMVIEEKLTPLLPFLPPDFKIPSRHTMSRYLEGCMAVLLHMPILHVPTFSAPSAAPDLLLAMMAVGCQFKYEGPKAASLFFAAKAAINYQLRLKDQNYSTNGPRRGQQHTQLTGSSSRSARSQPGLESYSPNRPLPKDSVDTDRLQTIQAILCQMVLGSWGPRQLVGEAIAYQSLVAELVRADGLGPESESMDFSSGDVRDAWFAWVETESLRRVKMFSYTFRLVFTSNTLLENFC